MRAIWGGGGKPWRFKLLLTSPGGVVHQFCPAFPRVTHRLPAELVAKGPQRREPSPPCVRAIT